MKKSYNIEVDCANCAMLIENAAGKVKGVESASVNFLAGKLTVEFCEGVDERKVMKEIYKTARKIEPDCEIEF